MYCKRQFQQPSSKIFVTTLVSTLLVTATICGVTNISSVLADATNSPLSSSSTATTNNLPRSSIPRSNNSNRRRYFSLSSSTDSNDQSPPLLSPPWNPSPNIDPSGFLHGSYKRQPGEWEKDIRFRSSSNLNLPCRIRQVPGDGNCLFHSISLCLYHAVNGTHWDITGSGASSSSKSSSYDGQSSTIRNHAYEDLYHQSYQLRKAAVECLSQSLSSYSSSPSTSNNRKKYSIRGGDRSVMKHPKSTSNNLLYLQGREFLRTSELVQAAAQQYGISPEEYCSSMEQESVWGGGPEIVALCNVLKRPIHVYELATSTLSDVDDDNSNDNDNRNTIKPAEFVLRRMACFGSPRFDKNEALHILSADSRFPDIQPGQQLAAGNHFLAVFPIQEETHKGYDKNRRHNPFFSKEHNREDATNDKRKTKQKVRGGFVIDKWKSLYDNKFHTSNQKRNYQISASRHHHTPFTTLPHWMHLWWLREMVFRVLGLRN